MEPPKAPQDIELRNIIDKLAQFVARNGPDFEQMTKSKQKGNSKFSFLFGGEHYDYYQFKVQSEQSRLHTHSLSPQTIGMNPPNPGLSVWNMISQQSGPMNPQQSTMVAAAALLQQTAAMQIQGVAATQPTLQVQGAGILPIAFPQGLTIEAIKLQQSSLQEQTSQSEHNLNAQHLVLMQQQQVATEEAIRKAEIERLQKESEQLGINFNEFNVILQPIIDTCTKDSISNGKAWILSKATSKQATNTLVHYLLQKIMEPEKKFHQKLHIIYLVNDILHHCSRKHIGEFKAALELVVVPMFCLASLAVNEEQQGKLNKLLNIWETKNHYFSDEIVAKLKEPVKSWQEYKDSLVTKYPEIVVRLSNQTKTTFQGFQTQHVAFVHHTLQQIQTLEQQKVQLEEAQKQQAPMAPMISIPPLPSNESDSRDQGSVDEEGPPGVDRSELDGRFDQGFKDRDKLREREEFGSRERDRDSFRRSRDRDEFEKDEFGRDRERDFSRERNRDDSFNRDREDFRDRDRDREDFGRDRDRDEFMRSRERTDFGRDRDDYRSRDSYNRDDFARDGFSRDSFSRESYNERGEEFNNFNRDQFDPNFHNDFNNSRDFNSFSEFNESREANRDFREFPNNNREFPGNNREFVANSREFPGGGNNREFPGNNREFTTGPNGREFPGPNTTTNTNNNNSNNNRDWPDRLEHPPGNNGMFPDLGINLNQPPPGFIFTPPPNIELPDVTRPPPGFPPVIPAQPEFLPEDLLPSLPYYDLPAGLMVPLVKLEDCRYKPLNPEDIRLPPPAPPSERLLAAVKAFYAPPGHDHPRDSDGWEKLGLYEYFKAKSNAKKKKETDIAEGLRERSKSPTPVRSFYAGDKTPPPKRRYSSRSRSRSRERSTSSRRRGRRDRERSPRGNQERPAPPSLLNMPLLAPPPGHPDHRRTPSPPLFGGAGLGSGGKNEAAEERLSETNKGHQLLKKMGWGGAGLGANEQGIEAPIASGDVRDRVDQYRGVGININDPYENFRKSKGQAFITRMKARAEERAESKEMNCEKK